MIALLLLPILVVTANPFHKYPYVFLLDIGNEELEKVNTEQIRLSSPGGSVALRYPAIGNGDDIAHVRVSGIDFGTDLKANVVNGGPGYKYVVIVLMGKPGVAFDAVITIQSVPDINESKIQTIEYNSDNSDVANDQEPEDDPNISAEDLTDYEETAPSQDEVSDKNIELTQESSNVYSYEQNEALSGYATKHTDEDSEISREDDNVEDKNDTNYQTYSENSERSENLEAAYETADSSINQRSAEASDDDYSQYGNNQPVIVDQNLYNKYMALKNHLYGVPEVYPQGMVSQVSNPGDQYDDIAVDEEAYEDYEEIDPRKYRDDNNNFIDTDGASAVEQ